jgi:hypothetical protein
MHGIASLSDVAPASEALARWRMPRALAIVTFMGKHLARRIARAGLLGLVGASALVASCASVEFQRDSETSGTFVSTGWAFTILSYDIPKGALMIARENASDARQPNMVVTQATVMPYLGWFDVLLDVISIRYARVSGTWGFPPGE